MTNQNLKAWCLLMLVGICAGSAYGGNSYPKGLMNEWANEAPPARYPEVLRVNISDTVPQWALPRRVLSYDLTAEFAVPPPMVRVYPFPHGITLKCRLPYPSEVAIAYRPKGEKDVATTELQELGFGQDRTTEMYQSGYFMVQWGRMAPDWNGILMGECLISMVPPEKWRGLKEPGPEGSEGLQFFISNFSINPKYYEKKYEGPAQSRSTPFQFTVTMSGP